VKRLLAVMCAACAFAAACVPASAATPSATVTVTSSTLAFNATSMLVTALAPAPVTVSASITFTTSTGGPGGTVTVTPASISSIPLGSTLDPRDFTLTCKRVSGNTKFVAAAPAILNGPTTCGTLSSGANDVTTAFSIELTLNDTTGAAVPFTSATYFGSLTVSATAS
jgi:hypothetical protein